jgi:hypothetical protein
VRYLDFKNRYLFCCGKGQLLSWFGNYEAVSNPHHKKICKPDREFKNYKWKEDQAGKATNEPIDKFNHGITFGETASLSKCGEV